MSIVFKGRYGDKREPNPNYCAGSVHDRGGSVGFHQCGNKPKVKRKVEGEKKKYSFCAIHDPEVVNAKHKARTAKWRADWAARDAATAKAEKRRIATAIALRCLRAIANGHNDARGLAQRALARFPKDEP